MNDNTLLVHVRRAAKYVGIAIDETSIFALREDGAIYAIKWDKTLNGPIAKLFIKLPQDKLPQDVRSEEAV